VTGRSNSDESGEATSAFRRADFLSEPDALPTVGPEGVVAGAEGQSASSALLVATNGPNTGSRFSLDQPVTSAGRHPGSDIFLDDVTVSRRHVEFRWDDEELRVVDLDSLNGTYVNRQAVESAVLIDGDEVQIGKFRLVFITGPRN
jgi:pSer/pThr/pTyr-binding forkhead associated (FHA) protein